MFIHAKFQSVAVLPFAKGEQMPPGTTAPFKGGTVAAVPPSEEPEVLLKCCPYSLKVFIKCVLILRTLSDSIGASHKATQASGKLGGSSLGGGEEAVCSSVAPGLEFQSNTRLVSIQTSTVVI